MKMKKVYLFCSAGMSTSMLASKMQAVANSHNLPMEVEAFPDGKIGQIIEERHPDVILLGPQVKYRYQEIVDKFGSTGIPIQVIDQSDYGMMNGEKVLKSAIKMMKSAK
jgi:PTS system cellobiose-specific IIB component